MPDNNIFDDDDALDIIWLDEDRLSGNHREGKRGGCLGLVLVLILPTCLVGAAMVLFANS
jgi:hypothetical protein